MNASSTSELISKLKNLSFLDDDKFLDQLASKLSRLNISDDSEDLAETVLSMSQLNLDPSQTELVKDLIKKIFAFLLAKPRCYQNNIVVNRYVC